MEKDKDYMEKIRYLEEYINKVKMKSEKIQKNFTFEIPNYVLEEIIESEENKNFSNVFALLNLAVVNGRITKENAKKVKEYYK